MAEDIKWDEDVKWDTTPAEKPTTFAETGGGAAVGRPVRGRTAERLHIVISDKSALTRSTARIRSALSLLIWILDKATLPALSETRRHCESD